MFGCKDYNQSDFCVAHLVMSMCRVFNSMKLSHALWGHPRRAGHCGEVWQNVVHWRREWQTTSVFLPWEPHEQYERQNNRILKEELPRSVGAQYGTGDQWRNNSRKNEGMEPKQKEYPAVDGTGDRSKVQCCKEQYCIGTWNVRSMNQGRFDVVKQEMASEHQHLRNQWTKMDGNWQI